MQMLKNEGGKREACEWVRPRFGCEAFGIVGTNLPASGGKERRNYGLLMSSAFRE